MLPITQNFLYDRSSAQEEMNEALFPEKEKLEIVADTEVSAGAKPKKSLYGHRKNSSSFHMHPSL
jgi:hypothetical protein